MITAWILASALYGECGGGKSLLPIMQRVYNRTKVAVSPIAQPAQSPVNQDTENQASVSLAQLLGEAANEIEPQAANKVLTLLQCVKQQGVPHQPILTLIDYHLPSNQKRLWVFDLNEKKLLYHTYVSHGIKSGSLSTNYFSNRYNSKASSIGVYKTEKIYYGRQGLSLKLDGLDRGFNDNAQNRAIVMHGGWYVNEEFIKKYGRPGRSWGCPALPPALAQPIINTIKENTLFVVYYPDENWMEKSKFLNCEQLTALHPLIAKTNVTIPEDDPRDAVLFADLTGNHNYADSKPLVVISASNYSRLYSVPVPLNRMIRRQINKEEYVALSPEEFHQIALQCVHKNIDGVQPSEEDLTNLLYLVTPSLKMHRGYYVTEMKLVPLGKIREIEHRNLVTSSELAATIPKSYAIFLDKDKTVPLGITKQFIRWLGL